MKGSQKTALIFGVDGQDGSYLAELLVDKGYHVCGWVPAGIPLNEENLVGLKGQIEVEAGNFLEQAALERLIETIRPDEIYNLAAPSFAAGSWTAPVVVGDVAGLGVTRLLEAVRLKAPQARFFQASSAEVYGDPLETPQDEETPVNPRNPYGIAKASGHFSVRAYRQQYALFAVSGILFNHESPRHGKQFVTRKITSTAAQIRLGLAQELRLGDLEAQRDWGWAGDMVRAMWLTLQASRADDYVLATGETHSVRQVCQEAFGALGLDYADYVIQDETFLRPREKRQLVGNSLKAQRELGWRSEVSFSELIQRMVEADVERLRGGA